MGNESSAPLVLPGLRVSLSSTIYQHHSIMTLQSEHSNADVGGKFALECRRRGTGLGLILPFDVQLLLSLHFPVHTLTTVARSPAQCPLYGSAVTLRATALLALVAANRCSRVACVRSLQRRHVSPSSPGTPALAGAYVFKFELTADGAAFGSSYTAIPRVDVSIHHGARGRYLRMMPEWICVVRHASDPIVQQSVSLTCARRSRRCARNTPHNLRPLRGIAEPAQADYIPT
jgi:hypothetical protein